MKKLEDDFEKAGGEWREYRIEDYFDKLELKCHKTNFDKLKDTSKVQSSEFDLPLINAKLGNNGIMFYGRSSDFDSAEMTIDIISNGAVATGTVYPQIKKVGVLWDAYLIKFRGEISPNQLKFLAVAIEKAIKQRFGWENKAVWTKVRFENISLPTLNNKIAFSYMESYIKALEAERIETLEAERIETLEAYLTVTNLRDYRLTKNDEKILDRFDKLSDTKSRVEESEAFRLSPVSMKVLFPNIHQGRRLKKDDQIEGELPFVMAGTTNTGVVKNIGNDVRVFPKHSLTIDIFGNTFYRNYEFGAGDDTGVFWNEELQDYHALLYLKTVIGKSLVGKYDFGSKLRASQTYDFQFDIPHFQNEIDYSFMSDFIRVIEKMVIKDVVVWADKKIAATKEVVAR